MNAQDHTETLVKRARGGDRAAFEELVDKYEERLERWIRSRIVADLSNHRIQVFGSLRDTDGDGIPDDQDLCSDSDPNPTVVIGGFDCNVGDTIAESAATAPTPILFVFRVVRLTIDLRRAGLVSGIEQRAILFAALRAVLSGTL